MEKFILKLIDDISDIVNLTKYASYLLNLFQLKEWYRRRRLKKILSLHNEICYVSLGKCKHKWFHCEADMVLVEEIEAAIKVCNVLSELSIKFSLNKPRNVYDKDEILLGGPASNDDTAMYLTKYFPDFRYYLHSDIASLEDKQFENKLDRECIELNKEFLGIKLGHRELPIKQGDTDYAVIIKLVSSDFHSLSNKKTAHIIFGAGQLATLTGLDYFLNHFEKLPKKGHYFYALKINRSKGDTGVNISELYDLTKDAFDNKY